MIAGNPHHVRELPRRQCFSKITAIAVAGIGEDGVVPNANAERRVDQQKRDLKLRLKMDIVGN